MSRRWILLAAAYGAFVACAPAPQFEARSPEIVAPSAVQRVLVTADRGCPAVGEGKRCEVLEVMDLHTRATNEEKGFDELRARAVATGGDAVIGAEFEHGEEGGPSHLSGMIVRYAPPVPPYVDLGEVEIESDPNAKDKGLTALVARSRAMGGDRVVDVTFEHGEDGRPGRLRGRAVRYER